MLHSGKLSIARVTSILLQCVCVFSIAPRARESVYSSFVVDLFTVHTVTNILKPMCNNNITYLLYDKYHKQI